MENRWNNFRTWSTTTRRGWRDEDPSTKRSIRSVWNGTPSSLPRRPPPRTKACSRSPEWRRRRRRRPLPPPPLYFSLLHTRSPVSTKGGGRSLSFFFWSSPLSRAPFSRNMFPFAVRNCSRDFHDDTWYKMRIHRKIRILRKHLREINREWILLFRETFRLEIGKDTFEIKYLSSTDHVPSRITYSVTI